MSTPRTGSCPPPVDEAAEDPFGRSRRRRSPRAVVAVGLVGLAFVAVAGCSSGDDAAPATTTTSTQPTGTTEGASTSTSATAGDADTVIVQDFEFTPATITVATGTAVTFQNDDGFTHTATAGEPGKPSGAFDVRLSAGTKGEVTAGAPGTYPYFCSIHEQMRGELVVTGG